MSSVFFPSVDSDSLHHESRHASDDPNTTNIFINTIPRAVNESFFSSSLFIFNNLDE